MNRFNPPKVEPEMTREQDAKALEVSQARLVAAQMRKVLPAMGNFTDLGALIEDFAARIEVAADGIAQDNNLPIGPRMQKALGDYLTGKAAE